MQNARRWGIILFLIFAFSLAAAGYLVFQLGRTVSPVPAGFLAAEKGYGTTIDLTVYNDADLSQVLADMQDVGLEWLRQPVNWADIEPEPGQFNWVELDRVMMAVAQQNATATQPFQIIFVLQTSPAWARPADSPPTTPPDEFRTFGEFARMTALRYGAQVDYYQIWHEPNLSANWGEQYVNPAAYADFLREGALNIRDADPVAYILTGALAATLENGPLNLNEVSYLEQLYQAKAADWFDIVAVQPFGLWTKPLDPPARDQPGFRRVELVRQVMLAYSDAEAPVWVTAFGWVALPANWQGQPSPWSHDLPSVQVNRTRTAIDHARGQWPWLGPMLAARWDATGLTPDDPARGFALVETPPLLTVFRQAAENNRTTTIGHYPATHITGHYSEGWRFATTRADIPAESPRHLTLFFEGTRLDLDIQRGQYRGYMWVTIDGLPANSLPQDGQGRSYVVLYDPVAEPDSVTLARYLEPGRHTAVIEVDGGWGQWVVGGWTVSRENNSRAVRPLLAVMTLFLVASGGGLLWLAIKNIHWGTVWLRQLAMFLVGVYDRAGDRGHIAVTFGLACLLYLLPGIASLVILPLLAVSILLRPDIGLALVVFATFFFQTPVRLVVGGFSPVELALALTIVGLLFRAALAWSSQPAIDGMLAVKNKIQLWPATSRFSVRALDLSAMTLVILALLATLVADNFAVSLREWRTVVVEPVIFYFLVRLSPDFSPVSRAGEANAGFRWILVDAFVTGATVQAVLALYFYFFTDFSIDAEGVHRALGLGYGSPNNLALVLGRVWPILLAVSMLSGATVLRRGLYGVGLLLTGTALYLTFSKGALLLGVPAGLLVMVALYVMRQGRPGWPKIAVAGVAALLLLIVGLVPISRTDRFRTLFEVYEGSTAFFRIKLWQASLSMLADHWPLGVGLDNFLYQYRSRYILPEAWQEPNLNHPHNVLLDFGTRLGIGGIVLLLWLQISYWRTAWQLYHRQFSPLLLGLMGSMVVFLAHGLVDNSYFLVDLAFAFFLNAGLVVSMKAEEQ
jgi:O-antigen ligase